MGRCIFLIVGRSGSGKTTLVEALGKRYGLKSIQSYTTRPARSEDETGHIFVNKEDFEGLSENKDDWVGYTVYNDNYYWATKQQVEENDLYVIDPAGVDYFLSKYDGKKKVRVVVVYTSQDVAAQRMYDRGDTKTAAQTRAAIDQYIFSHLRGDFKLDNNADGQEAFDNCVKTLYNYIREQEESCEKMERH